MVQPATASTRTARPISKAWMTLMRPPSCGPPSCGPPSCGWTFAPQRLRNELRHRGTSQLHEHPDGDELQGAQQAVGLWQQAEHDQAEAEIVGFGQGVQTVKRAGKAQQSTGPRHEKAATAPSPAARKRPQ